VEAPGARAWSETPRTVFKEMADKLDMGNRQLR
jgi:hypothetical protein